jgi:hypothetical protein
MADNPPNPRAPRWRPTGKATEGYQRVAVKSAHRTRKALGLTALILGLAGAAVAWWFYPRPKPAPAFVALAIREYDHFPFNAFALQDSKLLVQRFPQTHAFEDYSTQEQDRVLGKLSDLKAQSGQTLVLYLRAHALRDDTGVYVLPSNAKPGRRDTWIALDDVLTKLRECPAKHKLLLLDLMQPIADPRVGILANDVPEGVKATLQNAQEKQQLPDLLVLCSCAAGQVSLLAEDAKLSAFAYYLDQGLSGRADKNRDGQVTARELAEYVSSHVRRWSRCNRGLDQEPILVGAARQDFPLLEYDPDTLQRLGELPPVEPYPDRLKKRWEERDKREVEGIQRRLPGAFQQVEYELLAAERDWRGGKEPARIQEQMQQRLQLLPSWLEEDARIVPPRANSLARLRGRDKPVDPKLLEQLRVLLNAAASPSVKAEDVPKVLGKIFPEMQKTFKDLKPEEMAAGVFEIAVADTELTTRKLRVFMQILEAWPGPALVETEYLKRLVRLADKAEDPQREWPWNAQAASQCLQTIQAAETAIADPAALPWIKDRLQEADLARRKGEHMLFDERHEQWNQAAALLAEAFGKYTAINTGTAALANARQWRDDALAFLPEYVGYLNRLTVNDRQEVENWETTLGDAVSLYGSLAKVDAGVLDGLSDRYKPVRSGLGRVQTAYSARQSRFVSHDKDNRLSPSDYGDFELLLSSPRLRAPERETLWLAARKWSRDRFQVTRAADEAEFYSEPPPQGFVVPDVLDPGRSEVGSPERRARLGIALLNIAGLPETKALDKRLQKAAASTDMTSPDWRALADGLYKAWTAGLEAKFQAAGTDLAKLDSLSRLSGLIQREGRLRELVETNRAVPQLQVNRRTMDEYRQFLGRHFEEESQAAGSDSPYGQFCTKAASDYQ